jgi:hypothetical protein
MSEDARSELTARIDVLLEFDALAEARHAGTWEGGEKRDDGSITAPWFDYDDWVLQFIRACGQNGWIKPFDWQAWVGEAVRLQDEAALQQADEETLGKLLTLHIRRDRFFEGHLANMIESGHIAAILRRMRELRPA